MRRIIAAIMVLAAFLTLAVMTFFARNVTNYL